ncbi:unnamed protein product [Withania somnifera]
MDLSPLRPKITLKHARSSSFPSPYLKSSSEATSSSLSSFTCRLDDLGNLLDYTEDVIQLPHAQQAISQDKLDELLEGYLKLLDVCATNKDLLSNEKQNKLDLLSTLRTRRNMDDISSYQTSRKNSKKMIQKLLKDLKFASMLKEVQSVSLGPFKALLSYANGTGTQSSGWALLSKVIHSEKEEVESNEFDNNQLREMEATVEVLEEGLEYFFRPLIKTRVSLLNVFNH